MSCPEDITLTFSVAEKVAFLQKHGYTVKRKIVEREQHLHGSTFAPLITIETTVTKGEYTTDLHTAFTRVLLNKLLEL